MSDILTAQQMRLIEETAIAVGAVTGPELMERAGQAAVAAMVARWPELFRLGAGTRAAVLCGPGNNGGDGLVMARLLAGRGWQVTCFLSGHAEGLPPAAAHNLRRWCAIGPVHALDDAANGVMSSLGLSAPDVIVDALFGIGLTRPLGGVAQRALEDIGIWMGRTRILPRRVAVDIPSGLCADTGRNLGCLWPADLTVTFHAPKLGHFLDAGPAFCGDLVVADIGLPSRPEHAPVPCDTATAARVNVRALDKRVGHKFGYGHALVLAGGPGTGGAARLAARAALRVGAGLVTLACPNDALPENAARLDAIMLRAIDDPATFERVLADPRYTAICIGPGLGMTRAAALLPVALGSGRGVVVDADALTVHADNPQTLFDLLHQNCVLTPHGGEFARLFPDIAARLRDPDDRLSKIGATRMAAERAGAVVLFKGADTVIATPAGHSCLHAAAYDAAAPWLATAGSGDVLAGLIAGLLARGLTPCDAAQSGTWLHAACARNFGPGLIAEDLADALPGVFRDIGIR